MITAKRFLRWRRAIALALVSAGVGAACRSDIYSTVQRFATACAHDTTGEYGDGCPGDGEYGDGEYGDGEYGDGEYGGGEYGDGEYGDGEYGGGDDGGGDDGGGGTVDAGVDPDPDAGSPDADTCGDAGPPPYDQGLRRALECVALLNQARSTYHDALKAAMAGYPLAASTPTAGPSQTLSMMANDPTPPQNIFGMPESAQYAFAKAENFEESFYTDRVLSDLALYQCTQVLAALPMEPGYFGPRPTYPPFPPPPPPPDPTNTCFNNPPPLPAEPAINCIGVVVVAFDGYNAGEISKNGTEKCDDYTKHFAGTAATRDTGVVAMAFGGIRKEAKRGEEGADCTQASPVIQNWEMGIAAKPAGVFVPEQILEQKPGQAAQWVVNEKAKMLYYVYPDATGKPVKRGPTCRADTQLTVRTVADMHLPYYIHARVFEDPSGKSFRSKAYQARINMDQRCYGPGTLLANPGSFSIVASEQETKSTLKIVKDCQQEQAWNANFNVGASMGAQQGGNFGFAGGVTETIRCAVNLDIDQTAEGGCFANQTFGNISLTTKRLNGPFAIGSVYPLFNPNDPNQGTAPVNFLQMGMKIIGAQARATSSIDSSSVGTGGDGLATILTDRKQLMDKPEPARAKVKLGSTGCALLVGQGDPQPRPANECIVPVPDWPFLPKTALDKVPTAADLVALFDKLQKQIKDAAAR